MTNEWFDDSSMLDDMFEEANKEIEETKHVDGEIEANGLEDAIAEANQEVPMKPALKAEDLHDHELAMWNTIDKFEQRAWSGKVQGIKTGWSHLDNAFDGGLHTGWYVVAGDSNIG